MTDYERINARHRKLLCRAVRAAWREHRNVRAAAHAIGMPRSTFHDLATELGLDMSRPAKETST